MSGRRRPGRKRRAELSQHFLRDSSAKRLVHTTSISNADLVIEIGPGRGALTRHLIERARKVIAIEQDGYLAERLRGQLGTKAQIVTSDFLSYGLPADRYVVAANTPYGMSTQIIERLVAETNPPRDAWLVLQRELAYRMCGQPFAGESLWSLRLKPLWHLEIVDRLRRVEFDPPPSVDSVFVHFAHRIRPIISNGDRRLYEQWLSKVFAEGASVGKALRPSLSRVQLRRLAADLHFHLDSPPSELTFEQWLGIFRFWRKGGTWR